MPDWIMGSSSIDFWLTRLLASKFIETGHLETLQVLVDRHRHGGPIEESPSLVLHFLWRRLRPDCICPTTNRWLVGGGPFALPRDRNVVRMHSERRSCRKTSSIRLWWCLTRLLLATHSYYASLLFLLLFPGGNEIRQLNSIDELWFLSADK